MQERRRKRTNRATDEHWMQTHWRPAMAYVYLVICACDFVVFPVLWSILQAVQHGSVVTQWQPLSLQGAGLVHISFGAIIGVSAFGRSQEKVSAIANSINYVPDSVSSAPVAQVQPTVAHNVVIPVATDEEQ
jgi:hypothetical protein